MLCASRAQANSYYLSVLGNDAGAGSASAPWRTLARVNAVALQPGDRVLLRAGDTFAGGLSLDAKDAGTAAAPVTITSYGAGRAHIAAGRGAGIYVHNAGGVQVSNLLVTGTGAASGIVFFNDLPGDVKLSFVRVDAVEVSGFGRDGVEVGAWNGRSGFRDVRITNVVAHHNARTGIFVYAQQANVHESVSIVGARAFGNSGIAGTGVNSGSGIVVAGANGATIERSVAHDNGWLCDAPGGPVGIWTYDSTHVVIQHNESYANRTGGRADGGGFDLDQNVSYSTIQYNYSHDNDGAGFLLAHAPATAAHHDNVVRFNVSENDGRRNGYAALEVWGGVHSTDVFGNTVFVSPPAAGTPRAVRIGNASIATHHVAGLHFRNNIFQTTGGVPLVDVSASQLSGATDLRFEGNDYYSSGAAFTVLWGGTTYTTLAGWRATSQETLGGRATGFSVDPKLAAPGRGGTIGDAARLERLDAYRLTTASPLVNAALDLPTVFGTDRGTCDFFGTRLTLATVGDVGAHELVPTTASRADIVLAAADATTMSGAWQRTADASAARGIRLWQPNAGAAKLASALARPTNYFELAFEADAERPYRLWIRGKADGDSWANDSVFVQFSGSIDASGIPVWRIGSSSAASVSIEQCSGCALSGWGWRDNGFGIGAFGPTVSFATAGPQTIRIQTREDGVSIDQIVLSAETYLVRPPGAAHDDATVLTGPTAAPALGDVVIYASDIAQSSIVGDWAISSDSTAANRIALRNPNRGAAKILSPLAMPASYFDVPFQAQAGVAYHVWVRMRAENNATGNDSIYLQFSGARDSSGVVLYRIGTTSGAAVVLQDDLSASIAGWGWNDNGWASLGAPLFFATSGPQVLRVQQREDGVLIDQIVISSKRFLTSPPGTLRNDTTIVAR